MDAVPQAPKAEGGDSLSWLSGTWPRQQCSQQLELAKGEAGAGGVSRLQGLGRCCGPEALLSAGPALGAGCGREWCH